MKLTNDQRHMIELGQAMVYTTPNGAEYYIEDVLDITGKPSRKYKNHVYVFNENNDIIGSALEPFKNISEAKKYLDEL